MTALLTAQQLRRILRYDMATGHFYGLVARGKKMPIGSLAGSVRYSVGKKSYVAISIDRKRYYAHRLAWLYITGSWPNNEIDHIDGNGLNNAFANLRDVEHVINLQNQRLSRRDNLSTGLTGVSPANQKQGFTATIHVRGKRIHIGTFANKQDASAAYLSAKRDLHEGCTI